MNTALPDSHAPTCESEREMLKDMIWRASTAERAKMIIIADTLCGSLTEPDYRAELHAYVIELLTQQGICETTYLEYAS
jgi:hypothetical protein